MRRRDFLRTTLLGTGALAGGCVTLSVAQSRTAAAPPGSLTRVEDLPKGSAPAPVSFAHFPGRLHAFVWRNWALVPTERLARVVQAEPREIERLGRSMGLGRPPRVTPDQQRRSYLTVIRRNWHLLPYEQLTELLGWTPEQMAFTLREDDFFYIKLGSLKPACERLRWTPSDAAARRREDEIATAVQRVFPEGVAEPSDPPFAFVGRLSARPEANRRNLPPNTDLRFCYSYFALYGDPLLEPEADPYPEGYLARLASVGVNGVWLQAVLHKLAPFPWEPEISARWKERLENLRRLVQRAGRHGIKVFLYLNEPRAHPLRFFQIRPQLRGVVEGDYAALCTSAPEVQRFLVESVATVAREVPLLGGFFTISASENLTNCWSHHAGAGCPRCSRRSPAEVIAEVNGLFAEGLRTARNFPQKPAQRPDRPVPSGNEPRLIVWDWGWSDAWAADTIKRLPSEVALMSVSEWSLPIERGGVKSQVGEYSISAIGPGPRAQHHWGLARARGLRTVAKIQAGNTWELSTVPYIPALENVARHGANLRASGGGELMLGWTLGGFPSPNLEVVAEAVATGSAEVALQRVAERRFGAELAPAVVAAWRGFSAAFREFPYHIGVVYQGPQQMGPANLLWGEPSGYHATMTGLPYDDLTGWRAIYPPEVFAAQLEKVADGFDSALRQLQRRSAAEGTRLSRKQSLELEEECRVAEAASIHFRSTAFQARFVLNRDALRAATDKTEAGRCLQTLERCLGEELALARRLHTLQSADSRLGFEAANHYMFVPMDLAEKVLNCLDLLERWLPAQRRRWGL